MSTDHLLREHAPISDGGWDLLDQEMKEQLVVALGARKVVDFSGPHGWDHSATSLGRADPLEHGPCDGITGGRRRILPLAETRMDFSVSRAELLANDRGAVDAELDELDRAAVQMAMAENVTVFHGWPEAGITGITEASIHPAVAPVQDFNDYPQRVAKAVQTLLKSGVSGPYGLAVGPTDYTTIIETAEHGGYPLFDHLRKILDGPIVWTPGVRGGVVLSLKGGDFLFDSGQDLSIGYDHSDPQTVHLYVEQTFSFRVATPEAAVVLTGT